LSFFSFHIELKTREDNELIMTWHIYVFWSSLVKYLNDENLMTMLFLISGGGNPFHNLEKSVVLQEVSQAT